MFRMEISKYDQIIQLFKGGGEQNRPFQISRTPCPSILGRIYKDLEIESKYLGLEFRVGD